ncbi:MAG: hypothetical protein ACI4DS_04780 [Eubacterium sp.]
MSNLGKGASGFFQGVCKVAFAVILITLLLFAAKYSYQYGQKVFSETGYEEEPGTELTIQVPEGTSMLELSKLMEEYGVVEDYKIFYLQTLIYELKYVQAGTYTFNNSLNGKALINIINTGPEEIQVLNEDESGADDSTAE